MKKLSLIVGAVFCLSLAACSNNQEAPHDHAMACAKCECKAMTPDSADANKCKNCPHTGAEHTRHEH